jgi:hypothetical protein
MIAAYHLSEPQSIAKMIEVLEMALDPTGEP